MNSQNLKDLDCARLIGELQARGVVLVEEAGNLRLFGPDEVLTEPSIVEVIRTRKSLISRHLKAARNSREATPATSRDARFEPFPLTDIQRAYWVGRQGDFKHGSVAIHYYTEIDIDDLDHHRLEAAWNKTVRHHEMLRAVVAADATQRILPEVPDYEISLLDVSQLSAKECDAVLAEHRRRVSHSVHTTDKWPGFALHAFHLGKERYRLSYSQDLLHIDGGSLLLVIEDLCRWYREPDRVKPVPEVSFRDYVFDEIAARETDAYRKGLEYWTDVVRDLPPPPSLPVKQAKSAGRFRRLSFDLSKADHDVIKASAKMIGTTTTGWIMAVFGEIVSRWSGSEDCTLNVTVFNRPSQRPELLEIAGDFTSMVPVPIRREAGEDLGARARAMQRTLWRHMDHRDVSGITVLTLLRSARQDQGAADLSVVFTSLLNLGVQGFTTNGFREIGDPVYTITQTPQVTLDHQVSETPDGGVAFTWDVIEGHHPDGMIDDMFDAFRSLVGLLVEDDTAWTDPSVEYLPQSQIALFNAVNETNAPYPSNKTLLDLILERVSEAPDATALSSSVASLTYSELQDAAARLAKRMREAGLTAGTRVGILMEKGWTQPVAALAAHFAGASYVPIDPAVPLARFEHIVDDSDLALLLTDAAMAARFASHPVRRIKVDAACLNGPVPTDVMPELNPDDVSHIIYTSGSTGLPKGVVVSHRNVVNRMHDILTRFEISRNDVVLGLTALHHDLSVFDIFGVRAAGATLALPLEERRLDPAHWVDLMRCHKVTLWNSVPAFAGMLLDHLEDTLLDADDIGLRWMILAGDWIPVHLPHRLREHWPDLELIASGGPTETTIWDIWNRVEEVDPDWRSIPYGKPLSNAGYHILDRSGRRCPLWVPGEMFISGTGVTLGYLNRPDLTAEKYTALPWTDGSVFRSGDLGRFLPDGNIEFLGRNDFQVKVNGMRVELGEIEHAALDTPGVRDCVALVQDGGHGPFLTAFVTAAEVDAPTGDFETQKAAFEARGVTLTDPAERLAAKLAYAPLSAHDGAALFPLEDRIEPDGALKSHRHYSSQPIAANDLGRFLSPLSATREGPGTEAKFSYGSGGGLYPVQVYLFLKPDAVAGYSAGVYRYYPFEHALELVSAGDLPDDIHWNYNRRFAAAAPIYVYLIAETSVIAAQYGDLAEQMCLIEAGSMAQVLRQAASGTGIGICPVGDISFERTADRFHLASTQKLALAMVAGAIPPDGVDGRQSGTLTDRVKNALEATLPRHMLPASIVEVPRLPLTANGKIDRNALKAMEIAHDAGTIRVDPEDAFESAVAKILADMLGRDTVSAADNFFDIGASSALLVKAYHRIKAETGQEFPVIALFKCPSIRKLSGYLADHSNPSTSRTADDRAAQQSAVLKKLNSKMNKG